MPDKVRALALLERHVRRTPESLPSIEYLQCLEPLTWSARRVEAQHFADYLEADALARKLSTPAMYVFPVTATAKELAETVPARGRKRSEIHDWRDLAANSGIL